MYARVRVKTVCAFVSHAIIRSHILSGYLFICTFIVSRKNLFYYFSSKNIGDSLFFNNIIQKYLKRIFKNMLSMESNNYTCRKLNARISNRYKFLGKILTTPCACFNLIYFNIVFS
ncbi:hypothetical protein PUN28_003857 [Cardiocondyla obscurior]|uniref:Uncharacterized protein n=1 Tax=Cardiocondyla obscurior TaxID=286306 RepID=A0AAW2GMA7_9HYME